ncbi:hypothetical protein BJX68DRAFT_237373 [Aspergillus pseudodeflectus]|uniref:Uncharacterized protein n=1 Tax=Aspergillus pseudodeflectus TaxID=176178 RepID=A0ABR4KCU9_9EURO
MKDQRISVYRNRPRGRPRPRRRKGPRLWIHEMSKLIEPVFLGVYLRRKVWLLTLYLPSSRGRESDELLQDRYCDAEDPYLRSTSYNLVISWRRRASHRNTLLSLNEVVCCQLSTVLWNPRPWLSGASTIIYLKLPTLVYQRLPVPSESGPFSGIS